MEYKRLKRLTNLIDEYHWYKELGLIVFIPYRNCKEMFGEVLKVDSENYPDCKATEDCLSIAHFEEFLEYYTTEPIEDIFPKEDEV